MKIILLQILISRYRRPILLKKRLQKVEPLLLVKLIGPELLDFLGLYLGRLKCLENSKLLLAKLLLQKLCSSKNRNSCKVTVCSRNVSRHYFESWVRAQVIQQVLASP